MRTLCNFLGQSSPGKTPNAGRLIRARDGKIIRTRGFNICSEHALELFLTNISSCAHSGKPSAVPGDCSPVELTIFACRCPEECYRPHRRDSFRKTGHSWQTIERSLLAVKKSSDEWVSWGQWDIISIRSFKYFYLSISPVCLSARQQYGLVTNYNQLIPIADKLVSTTSNVHVAHLLNDISLRLLHLTVSKIRTILKITWILLNSCNKALDFGPGMSVFT